MAEKSASLKPWSPLAGMEIIFMEIKKIKADIEKQGWSDEWEGGKLCQNKTKNKQKQQQKTNTAINKKKQKKYSNEKWGGAGGQRTVPQT